MAERLFDEIEGCCEGPLFDSGEGLIKAGVHRPLMVGISETEDEGADSIALSGTLICGCRCCESS